MPKPTEYDKTHLRNMAAIGTRIDRIFKKAAEEAAKIGASIKTPLPEDRIFSFDDFPATQKQIDRLLQALKDSMEVTIVNGVESAWTLSNNKNNALVARIFGDNAKKLTDEQYRRYFSTNGAALDAFKQRQVQGLNLSDRVWKYTDLFKKEIELALDLGIRSGESAAMMTRSLRKYLQHPDKLFRRVRDQHGNLRLSQAAKAFHPGRGVYRSSYKNARRLAATETNMAYRTSDYLRWQQMDFVVGIEIKLSNNHTLNGVHFTDICDTLKGRYPKDFKFVGWHPHCRCHAISILKTEDEMAEDTRRILAGEKPKKGSVNAVEDVPAAFKDWVEEHSERIEMGGNLPYFIKDNRKRVDKILGIAEPEPKKTPLEIAKERHEARTPEDTAKIQQAWNERRIAGLRQSVADGLLPKESLEGISGLSQDELNARIEFLQKTAKRHASRTQQDIENMQTGWNRRIIRRFEKAIDDGLLPKEARSTLRWMQDSNDLGDFEDFSKRASLLESAIKRHSQRKQSVVKRIKDAWAQRKKDPEADKIAKIRKAIDKKKIENLSDVQRIIKAFYDQFPEEFNNVYVKITTFNQAPKPGRGFTMGYSRHDQEIAFNTNAGVGYVKESPFDTLVKALNKIRDGKKLTLDQHRSINTVVHELLHQKASKYVALRPHHAGDFKRTAMEVMNEYASRNTHKRFLERLGATNFEGHEEILRKGDGYQTWTKRLIEFVDSANLKHDEIGKKFAEILVTKPYDTMDREIYNFFKSHVDAKNFTQDMDEILEALENTSTKGNAKWRNLMKKWFS